MADADVSGDRGEGNAARAVAKTPARRGRPAAGAGVRVRYPYLAVDLQRPVVYRDQLFLPGGQKALKSNRGGADIRVDCWSTHCAECGKLFGFYTVPRDESRPFGFLRRCETHRKRGKPIDAARFRATRPAFADVAGMIEDGKRMWAQLVAQWAEQDAAA